MIAPNNFIDYILPEYDFSVANNPYTIQPVQTSFIPKPITYTPPVIAVEPKVYAAEPIIKPIVQPVVAKKTISFTIKDATETIPGANIEVNGVGTAVSDSNGRVVLPNISLDAAIRISYIGFDDYITTASTIPSIVILKEGTTMLDEIVVFTKKKATSNLVWWLAGAVAAFGIYKYSKSGTKVVKAKI